MKAIETTYKGYKFRSRTEARWAVFFDSLGLQWEYEPEGFDLGSGVRYLPDFRVTSPQGLVSWYEIKRRGFGDCPKMGRFGKAVAAEYEATHPDTDGEWYGPNCTTLQGDPSDVLLGFFDRFSPDGGNEVAGYERFICPRCGEISKRLECWQSYGKSIGLICGPCDWDTPSGGDWEPEPGALVSGIIPHKGNLLFPNDALFDEFVHTVRKACAAARSARFEFGESGARA